MPELPPQPLCPRCGYDQSGTVATWTEACPLQGQCPECGYEFAWREVYYAHERTNALFIEHARWTRVPIAACRTLLWTVIPAIFWRQVQLRHDVRKRRWLAWFIWTILLLHFAGGLCTIAGRWAFESRVMLPPNVQGPAPFDWWWVADAMGWPLIDVQGGFFGRFGMRNVVLAASQWSAFSVFMATMSALMMVLVLVLPQTRKRCRVQVRHVLRAAVYSWSWLAIPVALRLLVAGRWTFEQLVFDRDPDLVWLYLLLHRCAVPLIALGFAWQTVWWGMALGIGWRMPGAWRQVLVLAVGAGVVGLMVAMVWDPYLRERVFDFSGSFSNGGGWRQ